MTFSKINNLYLGGADIINNDTYSYGSYRQHNLSSGDSLIPSYSTLVDKKGLDKFYSYSLNLNNGKSGSTSSKVLSFDVATNSDKGSGSSEEYIGKTQINLSKRLALTDTFFTRWLSQSIHNSNINLVDDIKGHTNPFKGFFKFKNSGKRFMKEADSPNNTGVLDELSTSDRVSYYS